MEISPYLRDLLRAQRAGTCRPCLILLRTLFRPPLLPHSTLVALAAPPVVPLLIVLVAHAVPVRPIAHQPFFVPPFLLFLPPSLFLLQPPPCLLFIPRLDFVAALAIAVSSLQDCCWSLSCCLSRFSFSSCHLNGSRISSPSFSCFRRSSLTSVHDVLFVASTRPGGLRCAVLFLFFVLQKKQRCVYIQNARRHTRAYRADCLSVCLSLSSDLSLSFLLCNSLLLSLSSQLFSLNPLFSSLRHHSLSLLSMTMTMITRSVSSLSLHGKP